MKVNPERDEIHKLIDWLWQRKSRNSDDQIAWWDAVVVLRMTDLSFKDICLLYLRLEQRHGKVTPEMLTAVEQASSAPEEEPSDPAALPPDNPEAAQIVNRLTMSCVQEFVRSGCTDTDKWHGYKMLKRVALHLTNNQKV